MYSLNIIFIMKETSPRARYDQEYAELKCIGKGNFGTAYLVKSHTTNGLFIAKKIALDALSDKEIEGAFGEVSEETISNALTYQ